MVSRKYIKFLTEVTYPLKDISHSLGVDFETIINSDLEKYVLYNDFIEFYMFIQK